MGIRWGSSPPRPSSKDFQPFAVPSLGLQRLRRGYSPQTLAKGNDSPWNPPFRVLCLSKKPGSMSRTSTVNTNNAMLPKGDNPRQETYPLFLAGFFLEGIKSGKTFFFSQRRTVSADICCRLSFRWNTLAPLWFLFRGGSKGGDLFLFPKKKVSPFIKPYALALMDARYWLRSILA